jgi:hypothetical protein
MGNRAVLQFGPDRETSPGIYLHWNGGRASVQAFLVAAKALGVTGEDMALARDCVASLACAWLGGSVYVGRVGVCDTDNHDNGTFVISADLDIVERWGAGSERAEEVNDDKTDVIASEVLIKAGEMGAAIWSVRPVIIDRWQPV